MHARSASVTDERTGAAGEARGQFAAPLNLGTVRHAVHAVLWEEEATPYAPTDHVARYTGGQELSPSDVPALARGEPLQGRGEPGCVGSFADIAYNPAHRAATPR